MTEYSLVENFVTRLTTKIMKFACHGNNLWYPFVHVHVHVCNACAAVLMFDVYMYSTLYELQAIPSFRW